MQELEQEHHLRFSIEFLSIKNLPSSGQYFFKLSHELLGLCRSQTYNFSRSIEMSFTQEFHSHEFFMSSSSLQSSLTTLQINLYQKDSYSKDQLIGSFSLDLIDLLSSELRKTESSVIRVLDVWLQETFASLHISLFLEDLGPKSVSTAEAVAVPATDWEVQAWRKAEEAKFLAFLKGQEAEHLDRVAADWVLREKARAEQSEELIVNVGEMEAKLRGKMVELGRRETKIAAVEEEIKLYIADLNKQVEMKDEELKMWKEKLAEVRTGTGKDVKIIKNSIQVTRENTRKIEEEIVKFRKMTESQEVKDLKVQLAQKLNENAELMRKWQISKKAKEDVESTFFKLKGDLNKTLRVQDSERRIRQSQEREELVKRRMELETIRYQQEECMQIKEVKDRMAGFRTMIK